MIVIFINFSLFAMENSNNAPQNKIVYLISTIRSLSTAFLRMMEARGDFCVVNEPCNSIYDKVHYPEYTKDWYTDDAFKSFNEVKKFLFEQVKQSSVFVAEMSFAAHMVMMHEEKFMESPLVQFIFLVRSPHHSSISLYNKLKEVIPGLADGMGYKASRELFDIIKTKGYHRPIIIRSEDLYSYPIPVVTAFCQQCDIPFREHALKWQPKDQNFSAQKEWHQKLSKKEIDHWHKEAIDSHGLTQPTKYEVDEYGLATFSEIKKDEDRVAYKDAYYECLKDYECLLANKNYILLHQDIKNK